MAGATDYTATALLNWETGQLAMPANAARYVGLFTTAPTSDSGVTGAVEVSGGAYARVQVAGTGTTNATTASGNAVLHFAATPAWLQVLNGGVAAGVGCSVTDLTAASVIPAATTILSVTATTVTMSANASGAGVGNGDTIVFSAFIPAVNSSGAEPSTTPATCTSNGIIPFAQATASWGTAVAAGLFDALTSGNLITWDFLGNFKWLPFSGTSASPSVLTAPAHGYSNSDSVVVSAKPGGTLPATAGSWAGLLTVASATTDTFTAGVNSTGTGDGLVRKVASQPIAINVTMAIPVGSLVLTAA